MAKSWKEQKKERGRRIATTLYTRGLIQTVFNTKNEEHKQNGWELKDGSWSPYFVNLRLVGNYPDLIYDIGLAMGYMRYHEMPEVDKIVGVEMAGIPIAVASSVLSNNSGVDFPFLYTRPLPAKVRKPEEAAELLARVKAGEYGQKSFLEGVLEEGDNLAIWDDLVTSLGSKLIARQIVEYEAEQRGVSVTCNHIGVVLDREQGAQEAAEKAGMQLHALFGFSQALEWLKEKMHPYEHEVISEYLRDPSQFQTEILSGEMSEKRRIVLREAASITSSQ